MNQLKTKTDYSQALLPDGIAVLEGTTTTCPNCTAMAPFITGLMKKYPDVRWYTYDVDSAEDIAQELGARQVPSFSIFKDGMIEGGVTGAKREELEKGIREVYDGEVVEA